MISQVMIAVLGGLAITLVCRKDRWQKYGFVVGLLSQPWWLYVIWQAEQWGMFALSCWYTWTWATGIRNHWRPQTQSGPPATQGPCRR